MLEHPRFIVMIRLTFGEPTIWRLRALPIIKTPDKHNQLHPAFKNWMGRVCHNFNHFMNKYLSTRFRGGIFIGTVPLLRIMKLTYLLLTVGLLQVYAETSAQKLTIQKEKTTLRNVFGEIHSQTGYSVVYSVQHIEKLPPIDVSLRNLSLNEAMTQILAGLPLDFVIAEKEIIIKQIAQRERKLPLSLSAEEPMQQTVSGRVVDEDGNPLVGAAVRINGMTREAGTDSDGRFTLSDVPNGSFITVSFIGYEPRELLVSENLANIVMYPAVSDLDEVVVVGYGTQRKSDITGAVSSIRAEDFNRGTNPTFDQLIAGKAAGVQVVQNSGEPGGGISVRVRGASSINANSSPLYVIDGLPIDNSTVAGGGGANFDASPTPRNPLAGINPEDIESIEILKDASATAIYGSRGANGVIMVTTKRGRAGQNSLVYSGSYGQQRVANTIDLLSPQQYINVINGLIDAGGGPESNRIIASDVVPTDWQAQVFDNGAAIQNHSLAFSGGNEQTQYYLGLNAFDQSGIVKNTAFSRYSSKLNISSSITERLEVGAAMNISYSHDRQVASGFGINAQSGTIYTALNFDPTLPIYDTDGSYQLSPFLDMDNPMSLVNGSKATSNAYRMFGTVYAQYKILPHLTARINTGGDVNNRRRDVYVSRETRRAMAAGGSGSVINGMLGNYLLEGILTYDRRWENHYLNVMGGATTQRFVYSSSFQDATGFPSDVTGSDNLGLGDQETFRIGTNRAANRLLSYIGRVNYELNNKYLFTVSLRADGSSRFGVNNRFGYFPSFALGWKMMEEDFMQGVSILSDLKPRFSWGQTGNQEIGNYIALTTFGGGPSAILDDRLNVGTQPARYPNPDLKWETTEQLNVGLDLGFFNERVSAHLDYFTKTTYDMLFALPLPSSTGYASRLSNVGSIRNHGWEFAVNTDNLTGELKWATQLNLATLKNKVVDIGQDNPIITGGAGQTGSVFVIRPGAAVNSFFGWAVDGIWQEGDDFSTTRDPVQPGDIKYRDVNGDGTVNGEDRILLGNSFPILTWSVGNQFSYKQFSLSVFIDGVSGVSMLNNNLVESYFPVSFRRNRYADLYLNRWTPENPSTRFPSFINPGSQGDKRVNSLTVEDASYVRLRTITLSYQLMPRMTYLKNIGINLSIENLATFTNYSGFDPTINPNGGAFNRIDYNAYPLARTWMVGLTADF